MPPCDSPNTSGQGGGGGGGGGRIQAFQVGNKALEACCFVAYSTHQGVLSYFRFDATLHSYYDSLQCWRHALFLHLLN